MNMNTGRRWQPKLPEILSEEVSSCGKSKIVYYAEQMLLQLGHLMKIVDRVFPSCREKFECHLVKGISGTVGEVIIKIIHAIQTF